MNTKKNTLILFSFTIATVAVILSSCSKFKREPGSEYAPNMYYPIAYNPDQKNPATKDGKTAQLPVKGTLSNNFDVFHYPNTTDGYEAAGVELKNPIPVTQANIAEGKKLFNNFCVQCHGKLGKADGSLPTAGKFPVPAYQSEGIKNISEGKIFFSIHYGKNLMGSHASQLSKTERWKVVQYVQTLQKL